MNTNANADRKYTSDGLGVKMTDTFAISADYSAWLGEIKSRILSAQISAAVRKPRN